MTNIEPLQTNDAEAELRNEAIDLYIRGDRPVDICQQLGRSRTWFYKALGRYRREGRAGLRSRSRTPKRVHNRTPEDVEAAVVRVRKTLTDGQDPVLKYGNQGADAIAVELRRAKVVPPSRTTINRILNRHNLVYPRSRKGKQPKLPKDYPWPKVKRPNQVHLMDFVTRKVAGGCRFYGCHLLDQGRRWPYLRIIETKSAAAVSQFFVSAWQEIGIPQALYIDNDAVWRGSSFSPRTFSRIVRLCLLLGIEVIFIPPYTPEANPIIESFNSLWDSNFWQRTAFDNPDHARSELPYFEQYCRYHRPLAQFDHQTANQVYPDFVPRLLEINFTAHLQKRIPLTAGHLHFIRFVSQTGYFSLLNETWQLEPEQWAGKTIRATVDIQRQQLSVFHQAKAKDTPCLVTQFEYQVNETVVALHPRFRHNDPSLWPASDVFNC